MKVSIHFRVVQVYMILSTLSMRRVLAHTELAYTHPTEAVGILLSRDIHIFLVSVLISSSQQAKIEGFYLQISYRYSECH